MLSGMDRMPDEPNDLVGRLRRIEGQVRGVAKMVEEDRYCIDVLTQVSAVTSGMHSVAVELLDGHLRHCVTDAIAADDAGANDKVREATTAISRLLKS
jgi:DNA-binding FrmR family transcriptional regulator